MKYRASMGALLLAFALTYTACGGETSPSTSGATSSGGGGGGGGGGGSTGSTSGTGGSAPMACVPGELSPCYTGPAETRDMGLCAGGVMTCLPDGSGFGPCENEILPKPETCSTLGDDNCNGVANEEGGEGCVCTPGTYFPCYTGPAGTEFIGECIPGYQICYESGTGYDPTCYLEITPKPETCNTLGDDDCDGVANEGGPGCVCMPGEAKSCYTGPPGTLGVGVCKGGTWTCKPQGNAFGPCMDQVVPQPESCTVVDDDCDGLVNEENKSTPDCGANFWSKRFGDDKSQEARAVAVDASGNVAITGSFVTSFDFGGGTIFTTMQGTAGIFVAMLNGAGDLLWAKGFGNGQSSFDVRSGTGLAFDPLGNLLVTGYVQGPVDFGNGPLPPVTGSDGFLVKFDPQGNTIWSKRFGKNDQSNNIIVDGDGAALLTGSFVGTVNFGTGPIQSEDINKYDTFLVKFDANGQALWTKTFGLAEIAYVSDVVIDASGNILATGMLDGSKDFGNGIVTSNEKDILLAKYDPMGALLSAKAYGGANDQRGSQIALDSSGSVIVVGTQFFGTVLATKINSAGNVLWTNAWANSSTFPADLEVDAAGNIVVTGKYSGTIDFGHGPLKATVGEDGFVVKISPLGMPLWSRTYPTHRAVAAALDAMGYLFVTGGFTGTIDFGGSAFMSAGDLDVFVGKFGL